LFIRDWLLASGFLCSVFRVRHGKQSSKEFSQKESFTEATVKKPKKKLKEKKVEGNLRSR
jgi:hypothetical protein